MHSTDPDPHLEYGSGSSRQFEYGSMGIRIDITGINLAGAAEETAQKLGKLLSEKEQEIVALKLLLNTLEREAAG